MTTTSKVHVYTDIFSLVSINTIQYTRKCKYTCTSCTQACIQAPQSLNISSHDSHVIIT